MQISLISGKGGTGKSSISAAFATLQKNVVLVDCDVDAANLYLVFDPVIDRETRFISGQKAVIDYNKCLNCIKCISCCRFDAISLVDNKVVINSTFCDGCRLCARICPSDAISMIEEDRSKLFSGSFRNGRMVYGKLAPGEENSGRLVDLVREEANHISKESGIETVIIDGPPGIGCPVISSVTGVDIVVIVTEPTKSGLHDLKRTIEVISIFSLLVIVLINKYDLNLIMTNEIESYCNSVNIEVAGKVPFNPLVVQALVQRKSVIEFAPESDMTHLLNEIYLKIINSIKKHD